MRPGETLPSRIFCPAWTETPCRRYLDRSRSCQFRRTATCRPACGDSVARAFSYGNGVCRIVTPEGVKELSARADGIGNSSLPTEHHLFSFNNPLGACPRRAKELLARHRHRRGPGDSRQTQNHLRGRRGLLARRDHAGVERPAVAYKFDFPIHTPFTSLRPNRNGLLWRGNEYFHGLNDFFA